MVECGCRGRAAHGVQRHGRERSVRRRGVRRRCDRRACCRYACRDGRARHRHAFDLRGGHDRLRGGMREHRDERLPLRRLQPRLRHRVVVRDRDLYVRRRNAPRRHPLRGGRRAEAARSHLVGRRDAATADPPMGAPRGHRRRRRGAVPRPPVHECHRDAAGHGHERETDVRPPCAQHGVLAAARARGNRGARWREPDVDLPCACDQREHDGRHQLQSSLRHQRRRPR